MIKKRKIQNGIHLSFETIIIGLLLLSTRIFPVVVSFSSLTSRFGHITPLRAKMSSLSSKNDNGEQKKNPKQKRLILLDRDGVINEDVGAPGVTDPKQLQLTPNASIAIGKLKRIGYKVAIITNQSCVGKGLISCDFLNNNIHKTLKDILLLEDKDAIWDKLYYCTSTKEMNDPRMKPSPGMVHEACHDFSFDVANCVFVGDTISDMEAATKAGVPLRILVSTGYGSSIMAELFSTSTLTPDNNDAILIDKIPIQVSEKSANSSSSSTEASKISSLRSILPFYYVKNLDSAVTWLLQSDDG